MAVDSQQILNAREDPAELERLYRADRDAFATALTVAAANDPSAIALRVWQVRLASDAPSVRNLTEPGDSAADILLVAFLCLISGTMAKLPAFVGRYDDVQFYWRNAAFLFLPALAGYFLARNAASNRKSATVAALFAVTAIAANAYPAPEKSQSVTLALLHLPFLLWAVVGYAFTTTRWSDIRWRTDYLRLNGEALIYTALVVITGMLTTAITMALFSVIKVDISDWYAGWVLIYGACAAPIVGMHLAVARSRTALTIAPLLARIFSPLALVIW